VPAVALQLLLCAVAMVAGQPAVCGRACKSDVQCPDARGVCTYCTRGACQRPPASCVGGPKAANTTKPQLLVLGDSISLGWSPVLFAMLEGYESQHAPTNCGPASKGFECAGTWLGNRTWDVVLFNFGLHSLDRHRLPDGKPGTPFLPTGESETLANFTAEVTFIAKLVQKHAKKAVWVDTTPVPLNVTAGPERHNQDVLAFNAAARTVMKGLGIPTADVYAAVMAVCKQTSGAPDFTYAACRLQTSGGVHFPQHYDVLTAPLFEAVTGRPAPPPAPPLSCAEAAAECNCTGATGKGGGQACFSCYMASKGPHPGVFDGPACLSNYSNHVPPLQRPQMAFVDCWCFGKKANCSDAAPDGVAAASSLHTDDEGAMKMATQMTWPALLLALVLPPADALQNGRALTPPMGWSGACVPVLSCCVWPCRLSLAGVVCPVCAASPADCAAPSVELSRFPSDAAGGGDGDEGPGSASCRRPLAGRPRLRAGELG